MLDRFRKEKVEPTPASYRIEPFTNKYDSFSRWMVVHPDGKYEKYEYKWRAKQRCRALNRHAKKET